MNITHHTTIARLAEQLYVAAMRDSSRERLGLPVDSWYWDERARAVLAVSGPSGERRCGGDCADRFRIRGRVSQQPNASGV